MLLLRLAHIKHPYVLLYTLSYVLYLLNYTEVFYIFTKCDPLFAFPLHSNSSIESAKHLPKQWITLQLEFQWWDAVDSRKVVDVYDLWFVLFNEANILFIRQFIYVFVNENCLRRMRSPLDDNPQIPGCIGDRSADSPGQRINVFR